MSFTFDYVSSFSTEPRPNAITIDEDNGYLYVANSHPFRNNDNRKIQKYNREGELLKTVVDFALFDKGNYPRYHPIDITMDNNRNLYILVKPYRKYSEDTWYPFEGFCILKYDFDDKFQKEFDFAEFDQEWSPAAIAYYNEYIFVTNGRIIKKISINSEQVFDITFPINEKNINTWPDIHTTDMAIDSEGFIYLVGQAAFDNKSVSCHITKIDPKNSHRVTVYSKGKTESFGAMFNNPGLSISSNGNIYLATFYCESLEIFNRNVEFIMQLEVNSEETRPIDVAVDNNHIYVVDNLNNRINVYKKH
ncbi:MAG: NHL repeat-containing protein [Bacteroidales bacterium]|nr:NHL repeat-containing protein [Bacteroidales bacterium]